MTIDITTALNNIIHPTIGKNIKAMGITSHITPVANGFDIILTTPFPASFLSSIFLPLVQDTLNKSFAPKKIKVSLTEDIRVHKTQLSGKKLKQIKNTIAIASGKGGVGKSTVTVNLATALAKAGARVGILDADIYGPSIPLMLGTATLKDAPLQSNQPVIAHGLQTMSIGYLIESDQALIWRGPMLAKALIEMLDNTKWDALDYLFIDLPPGTGDIQLSLVQKIPLTSAIVVTTPQDVATLDARKAIKMFEKTHIDVLGIIENMAYHLCPNCQHQSHIFGHEGGQALAKELQVPMLGQLPLDIQIRLQGDAGQPLSSSSSALSEQIMSMAFNVALTLSQKPLPQNNPFPPIKVISE